MKTALLTTDTTHHRYYAKKVADVAPWSAIFLETKSVQAKFETAHPFEERRDRHEADLLRKEWTGAFGDLAPTRMFASMNDPAAHGALREAGSEVIVVFGTGKLSPEVIAAPSRCALNLHGGNPEEYRGLDTHLWSIYHGDFENLVTTLHVLAPGLDTGAVVARERLKLARGMGLHELRWVNTEACVRLTLAALRSIEAGTFSPRPQAQKGRYYSFMPGVLKEVCVSKFEKHTAAL